MRIPELIGLIEALRMEFVFQFNVLVVTETFNSILKSCREKQSQTQFFTTYNMQMVEVDSISYT